MNNVAELPEKSGVVVRDAATSPVASHGRVARPDVSGRLFGTTPVAATPYLEAGEVMRTRDHLRAAELLRRALAADSSFAMAWRRLKAALGNGGLCEQERFIALENATRWRDRLPSQSRRAYAEIFDLRARGELFQGAPRRHAFRGDALRDCTVIRGFRSAQCGCVYRSVSIGQLNATDRHHPGGRSRAAGALQDGSREARRLRRGGAWDAPRWATGLRVRVRTAASGDRSGSAADTHCRRERRPEGHVARHGDRRCARSANLAGFRPEGVALGYATGA